MINEVKLPAERMGLLQPLYQVRSYNLQSKSRSFPASDQMRKVTKGQEKGVQPRDPLPAAQMGENGTTRRRAYTMSRLLRIRDEFNLKMRSTTPSGRNTTFLVRACEEISSRIFIDIGVSSSAKNSIPSHNEADEKTKNRNLTNFLSLMSLRDGKFRATFPVSLLPQHSDVIIRIQDGIVQFLTTEESVDRVSLTSRCPLVKYGYIQLPMYADTRTVQFTACEETTPTTAVITGSVKGCAKYEPHILPETSDTPATGRGGKGGLRGILGRFPLERSGSSCSLEARIAAHRGRSHTA